jgi:hypothetical protein
MGDIGYCFAFRIYLRQQTVRRLNRARPEDEARLAFKIKYPSLTSTTSRSGSCEKRA